MEIKIPKSVSINIQYALAGGFSKSLYVFGVKLMSNFVGQLSSIAGY